MTYTMRIFLVTCFVLMVGRSSMLKVVWAQESTDDKQDAVALRLASVVRDKGGRDPFNRDLERRTKACEALAKRGAKVVAVPAITDYLDELFQRSRTGGQEHLARVSNVLGTSYGRDAAPAVPILIRILDNPIDTILVYHSGEFHTRDEFECRVVAIDALRRIGTDDARKALIGAMAKDRNYRVRIAAADALGQLGSADAVPSLTKAMLKDSVLKVRVAAVKALGQVGSTDVIPDLEAVEEIESDKEFKQEIGKTIATIRRRSKEKTSR